MLTIVTAGLKDYRSCPVNALAVILCVGAGFPFPRERESCVLGAAGRWFPNRNVMDTGMTLGLAMRASLRDNESKAYQLNG